MLVLLHTKTESVHAVQRAAVSRIRVNDAHLYPWAELRREARARKNV